MSIDRDLLTTGAVAERLGVSRQQVVNLCDRGQIEHVMVGKHRRIPAREVDRMSRRPLTREQERSLWLHRAVLAPLLIDPPGVIADALAAIERWRSDHRADGMTIRYLREWERILGRGVDDVAATLVSPTPEACELRQNSPFAGVLDDTTRARVLAAFAEHWDREHDVV